jgi:S1-C subfamily serine protease
MTSPRHLWSGDWERDSASRADELAARERLQSEQPLEQPVSAPAPEERPPSPLRSALPAVLAALARALRAVGAGLRQLNPRAVLLVLIVAGVVVAGAFGLSALFGGSSSNSHEPVSLRAADALFGVQLSTPPNGGVVIATVVPGGPAESAGLDPGDALTAIDNRPVSGAGDVAAAVGGLRAGGQAVLQVSRGSSIISTLVTLTGHP